MKKKFDVYTFDSYDEVYAAVRNDETVCVIIDGDHGESILIYPEPLDDGSVVIRDDLEPSGVGQIENYNLSEYRLIK